MADTRVLLVSGEYPPDIGGIADYTAHLANALRERHVEVRIVTRNRPAPPTPMVVRTVPHWNAKALAEIAHHAPQDGLVHIQYQPAAFDLLGDICVAPLALRAQRPDVRVVTTFHDTRLPYLFRGARLLRPIAVRLLARSSAAVLAADPRDLRWLGRAARRPYRVPIGSNILRQPPPGYDRDEFRKALGFASSDLVVVYFGLLNQSKGLDVLLEAFRRLAATRPDAWLLVLGGRAGASDPTDAATAAEFESRLASFPLSQSLAESPSTRSGRKIVRPGYLEPSALSAHLLAADVALLPYADGASARRGSLLACAEHGLPIVTTAPVDGLPSGSVLACASGDAVSLARAVERAASEPDLRQRLVIGADQLASDASWGSIAARHLAVYQATLRGRAAPARA